MMRGFHSSLKKGHIFRGELIFIVIFCSFFIAAGVFSVCSGINECIQSKRYEMVSAECVSSEFSAGRYYSTYKYTIDDTQYENKCKDGWKVKEMPGMKVNIYYLISNPNEIYSKRPASISDGVAGVVCGVPFILFGAVFIGVMVKNYRKQNKQIDMVFQYQKGSIPKDEIHQPTNNCPYCGSRYKKTSDSCPKCGASRMD